MCARARLNAQALIPDLEVYGPETGDVLVLGWGGTFGACREAVQAARAEGLKVAHAQLRHLNPMPANMREILSNYRHILVPELNSGQLSAVIRAKLEIPARSLAKVQGRPFTVHEILTRIRELCAGETTA